jgi:hypothetical protein
MSNIKIGMANLFIQHTSASLTINENADPDVRRYGNAIMLHKTELSYLSFELMSHILYFVGLQRYGGCSEQDWYVRTANISNLVSCKLHVLSS